jgi:hypothetical protein
MNLYKYISVFGLVFFAFANAAFAQSEQLAQASTPEYRNVPDLTGDATKDAEIQRVRDNDYQLFLRYQAKANEKMVNFKPAAMDYLYSIGMPKMVYTNNAHANRAAYDIAYRAWLKTHEQDLVQIEQKLTQLNAE